MMKRTAVFVFTVISLAALAARAETTPAVSPDVANLRSEIRAYLLDHPEVLVEALQVLKAREQQAAADAERALITEHAEDLFDDPASAVVGNDEEDARLLVEFFDYRCGYCQKAHLEVVSFLKENPDVRLIRKELPILGPESELASRFAVAVFKAYGDDKYNEAHTALMDLRGTIDRPALARIAEELEIDATAILTSLDSPPVTAVIEKNRALARAMKIEGTPGFVSRSAVSRGFLDSKRLAQLLR